MSRTLPEKIVAVVEALAEHEEAVKERERQVLPLPLRAVVEQATSGLDRRLARA